MSRFDHVKTPLNPALQILAKSRATDDRWRNGKSYPCSVAEVVSSGVVKVKFEVNSTPFTLPQITVPVLYPEYVRYPIQVGDRGLLVSADVRTGGLSGLGSGTPDLSRPGNLSACHFLWMGRTQWVSALDPNAVEIYGVGTSGVILRSGDATVKFTLEASGITIETNGMDITINGGGDIQVNGGGDVIADTISLMNHVHSGVQTGSGDSGPPVP